MTDAPLAASSDAPSPLAPEAVLRHRTGVQAHPVMGELVLYDIAGNQALSLNGAGRSIWETLDGTCSLEQVVRAIASSLGCGEDAEAVAELLADTTAFATSLLERGLVEPVTPPAA